MGLLDEITSTFNKGAAAAERGAKTVKLKAQVSDFNKRRQQLVAQLGASLYEVTKDNPSFRAGRESLYDEIAECDRGREECLNAIAFIEQQSAMETERSSVFTCPVCGSSINGSDMFCSGCGTSVDSIKAKNTNDSVISVEVSDVVFCDSCGAPMSDEDIFCMKCGTKAEVSAEESN